MSLKDCIKKYLENNNLQKIKNTVFRLRNNYGYTYNALSDLFGSCGCDAGRFEDIMILLDEDG